jgi:glycosyltransferase involved in cell wall biosynthesis
MKVLTLTNMYPTPEAPAMGPFVRDQVESLRKEGVNVDVLLVNGKRNKLNYLWGIFRLWARLLTKRYDLIHANYVFSGIIARFQFLYPVVLTHHGHEVQTWERFPSRIISPLVDKVIVRSQEMKDKLGFSKAEIIPAGIDFDLFKPIPREEARRKLNTLPPDKKLVLVLWAGEFSRPEKRFDIIKSAIALAQKKDPAIDLVPVNGKPHDIIPIYERLRRTAPGLGRRGLSQRYQGSYGMQFTHRLCFSW